MARHEADREDLIRDATGLKNRVEWDVPGEADPVVTGLKSSGHLSLYFGQDPVYQFDDAGRLRRAYVGAFLYRTEGSTLACIHRERSTSATTLHRRDLSEDELAAFLATMTTRVARLRASLADGSAREIRGVCETEKPGFVPALDLVLAASPQLAAAIANR